MPEKDRGKTKQSTSNSQSCSGRTAEYLKINLQRRWCTGEFDKPKQ